MAGELSIVDGRGAAYFTTSVEGQPVRSSGADYYSGAKEPAGRWHGAGCAELGLSEGAEIDPDKFTALMDDHIDPRNGSRLGKSMHKPDVYEKYTELLSLEPEATTERKGELFVKAQAHVREHTSVGYFDLMFAPSKSITLVHAAALAMKAEADAAGDEVKSRAAQYIMVSVEAAIDHGVQAGMDYINEHAGFTRKGAGGVRQVEARGWIYAVFPHHTSRAGDPHLHRHCTLANVVQYEGKWLTPDSSAIHSQRPATEAVMTATMENDLTRSLGLAWYKRADGLGREVRGIPQSMIDEFSTRGRQEIPPELARLVTGFMDEFNRDPSPRELYKLQQQAARNTKAPKQHDDPRADVREWSARAAREAGQALAPLATAVCGQAHVTRAAFTRAEENTLVREAVAALQAQRSTFTQAALTRTIQQALPADMPVMDPGRVEGWLEELTARALTGEAGVRLVALEAPSLFSAVPDSLLRSDGEMVYTRHRTTKYATDEQLRTEGAITEIASERSPMVPHLEPADAAVLLGADQAVLEAQLVPGTPADTATVTGSGLHVDQAAAAFKLMTSDRRCEVLVGPAGTGKSRTLATIASVWKTVYPDARVIGLTESQQAANVLKEMGLADSHNLSMFFTDPRLRQDIPANSLILLDEASMVNMGHWDALMRLARERGCAVRPAGDHAQHQAVTAGGGMGMLVRRLGSWQLGEALRFSHEWERDASLRLRAGDTSVIPVYDMEGRILSGTREQMTEEAYTRWLMDYLNGTDSVLIAGTEADCQELSRRARSDLIRYGKVSDGPAVRLRAGEASAGDVVMARKNRHKDAAGVGDRTIANRDIYLVDEVRADGSAAVRLQLRDGTCGNQVVLSAGYLAERCHLAYGRTSHDVQGSTFDGFGYAMITPENDREFLYTSMTRAVSGNFAFAVTEGRQPEARPGPEHEAAPEVERARTLSARREGADPGRDLSAGFRDGAGVLAAVAARSDPELSAGETLARELSESDSLHTLIKYWTDLTGESYLVSYRDVLREVLGDEIAGKVAADPRATWLHRDLRAAELAGMNGRQVLREAVAMGDLTSAESVAAVLDKRVRQIIPATVPLGGGWAARAPQCADPELKSAVDELAERMDDRTVRLGEHAAETLPLWAERNLGAVPDDPAERAGWCDRAASVAAYREMAGYTNAADPIGPCPSVQDPERRAAWNTALLALSATDGIDVSSLSRGILHARRAAYAQESGWAPAHVGRELRLSRQARDQATVRAMQSVREMMAAHDPAVAAQHQANANGWLSVQDRAAKAADLYAVAMQAREAWDAVTGTTRRVAQAADLELHRTDPWGQREPLKSMEPDSGLLPDMEDEPSDIQILMALGLTPEPAEISDHPRRMADAAQVAQARIDDLLGTRGPEPEEGTAPSEPWRDAIARQRDSVAQPAVTLVRPAERVLEYEPDDEPVLQAPPFPWTPDWEPGSSAGRNADRDTGWEAGG